MEKNTTEFLASFNAKKQQEAPTGTVERPFIICPSLLPLAEREELVYRYTYLEDTIEKLALDYRLSPSKVKTWLSAQGITRKYLRTEEELQAFEAHVNETYKSIQVRLLGLTALNTAKSWQALATAEDHILASLNNASKAVALQEHPDPKTISSLAATHDKMVLRHDIIQKGLEGVESLVNTLKEELGFEVEITHVASQPKEKAKLEESNGS